MQVGSQVRRVGPGGKTVKDTATYTASGPLLFEPSGREVRAMAEGMRGRVRETASTTLTLRESEKARRALTRTIRYLRRTQSAVGTLGISHRTSGAYHKADSLLGVMPPKVPHFAIAYLPIGCGRTL